MTVNRVYQQTGSWPNNDFATARAPGKPGPVGKENSNVTLKIGDETQQVKVLPAQSSASRVVASFAWMRGNPSHEA
jgi:hypothetical protein